MPAIAAIPHQTHTPQLTPIMVSRAFQPEVRGAPQIKGHTRRSLGPNPLTQIRGKERSENDTFLRHNVSSKGSSSGVHIVYFCLFWCFLFGLMLFQRWLFSSLLTKGWSPFFGPELFLIVSVTGSLSYTGLPAAALKQRVGAASKPEWDGLNTSGLSSSAW